MSDTRKLNFSLPNGVTFNAEGPDDYVSKAFEEFKGLLALAPAMPQKAGKHADDGAGGNGGGDLPLDRLFTQDDYYGVALTAKPKTDEPDADGVLAILYGFAVLKKESNVTAMRLQRAAEKSGLDTPRLGRVVARHAAMITESGKGKGKRYGLNNPGMTRAAEILREILG